MDIYLKRPFSKRPLLPNPINRCSRRQPKHPETGLFPALQYSLSLSLSLSLSRLSRVLFDSYILFSKRDRICQRESNTHQIVVTISCRLRPFAPLFWPGPSAEMYRGFLLHNFWRILPGIFLEDFSGHFFPQKNRRRNPATRSAKKSGGPKIKPAKNLFCQKPTLTFSLRGIRRFPGPENLPYLWEVLLFLLYESAVFPHRDIGGKRWRDIVAPSIWCMFDSFWIWETFWTYSGHHSLFSVHMLFPLVFFSAANGPEGLGRKLLLTPLVTPAEPLKSSMTASQKMLTLQTLKFELSQCWRCKEGLPGPRRGFWVPSAFGSPPAISPQNGRAHLHIVDFRGPKNGAFGKPCLCPAKKRGFWRKWRKWRICVLTRKTRLCCSHPVTTKMTTLAGVTRTKAWFTKGTLFWFPDFLVLIPAFFSQRENQIHTITLMFTIDYLNSRVNGSLITPITFTYSIQSRELRPLRFWTVLQDSKTILVLDCPRACGKTTK